MTNNENLDDNISPIFDRHYRQTYDADMSMIPNFGVVEEEWQLWENRGNIVNPDFAHIDPTQGIPPEHLPEGVTSLADWNEDYPDWS